MSEHRRVDRSEEVRTSPNELERLGRIAGELIHDLAGALGILSSRIVLTRDDMHFGRASVEDIERLHRDCERLRAMVMDVLAELGGGVRSPEFSFLVVDGVEEGIERWMAGAPSVSIRLSSSVPRDARVVGARSFFDRAFHNLLKNAGRHARSEIRVTLTGREGPSGAGVLLTIEDDGAGVDPAVAEDLFEPLVRGPGGEVGLGLSLVQWAAERLGGSVEVGESDVLGGAAFRLWLPTGGRGMVAREQRAPGGRRPRGITPDRRSLDGLRVAVVDDERMLRNLYGRLLERSGARPVPIAPVELGDEATIAEHVFACDPDAVLLDLDLGTGDGIGVWRLLKERDASLATRILFLSGAATTTPLPSDEDSPPVLSKLLDWEDLAARIQRIARPRGTRGE